MNKSTVVVGVDASWRETGAVGWAVDEARRAGSGLHVLHVIDDLVRPTALPAGGGDHQPDAGSHLVGARPRALGAIRRPDRRRVVRHPRTDARAQREPVRDGRGRPTWRRGFSRLLVGSVSESVVSDHADVPVVVVPDGWQPSAHGDAPVLAGVDVSAPSDAALQFAFATAAERAVPLQLVHAWEVPAGYVWDASYASDELQQWAAPRTARLRRARRRVD